MIRARAAGALAGALIVAVTVTGCSEDRPRARPPTAPPATIPPMAAASPPDAADAALTVSALAPDTKAVRGQTVTATFKTRPGNSCQLEVRDAKGEATQRLAPTVANIEGLVSWSWMVNPDAAPGDAHAMVACSGGARGQATIEVS